MTVASEMEERVARAIAEADGGKGAPILPEDRTLARAAIEAIEKTEPVAWRFLSNAKGAKWTVQKTRPTQVLEKWEGYTVEPLFSLSAALKSGEQG